MSLLLSKCLPLVIYIYVWCLMNLVIKISVFLELYWGHIWWFIFHIFVSIKTFLVKSNYDNWSFLVSNCSFHLVINSISFLLIHVMSIRFLFGPIPCISFSCFESFSKRRSCTKLENYIKSLRSKIIGNTDIYRCYT